MKIDIGIEEKQREAIASGLSKVLADSYYCLLTAIRRDECPLFRRSKGSFIECRSA
jgi:hypothetical protein